MYAGQNFKAPCPSYRGGAGTVNMKGSPIWMLRRAAGGMANTSVCPAGVWTFTKSAEKPRHSCRGWIGVGRAGLNAQEPNKTYAVPEPSMGEGTA